MKTTKEQKIRIGLFTAIAVALVAVVLVVFGGIRFWKHQNHYHLVFVDSVYGLQRGAEVYLHGIRVGSVRKIEVDPADVAHVRVELEVDEDAEIRTDTQATMRFAGLTGLKVIDLQGGSLAAPKLPDGGTIAVGESTIDKFEHQAKEMADNATEMMQRANRLVGRADQIVANLSQLTDPAQLGDIIESTRLTARHLAAASANLHAMVSENRVALRNSIASIDEAAHTATDLLGDQVTGVVENVGDLVSEIKGVVRDDGQQLRAAMTDLKQASRTFKELARDVKARPSRLLFSKPEADRKLP
jgi:phospholipid/cholesterol/gamma-HCH transport system substrate-binding protein